MERRNCVGVIVLVTVILGPLSPIVPVASRPDLSGYYGFQPTPSPLQTASSPQKALFYDRNYITSDRFKNASIPSLADAKAAGVTMVGTTTNAEMSGIDFIWQGLGAWVVQAHALGLQVMFLTSVWNLPLTDNTTLLLMKRSAQAGADFIAFDEFITQWNWTKPQFDEYFATALAINGKIQFIVTEWDYDSLKQAYSWFNSYPYVRIADDGYNDLTMINDLVNLAQTLGAKPPIIWLIFSQGSQNFDCYLHLDTWMAYVKQQQLDSYFYKIDEFGTWQTQWLKVRDFQLANTSPSQSDQATTSITILPSQNSVSVNKPITFTVTLQGNILDQYGVVTSKQIVVTALGSNSQCTTGLDGTCQVTLTAPPTAGPYSVTAQFAGDANFSPSKGSITVNVVSTSKVNVNLQLLSYKVVNVKVDILRGSTVVVTRTVTMTSGSRSASMSFTLNGGTYVIRVSGYGMTAQTNTITIPPEVTVNLSIS